MGVGVPCRGVFVGAQGEKNGYCPSENPKNCVFRRATNGRPYGIVVVGGWVRLFGLGGCPGWARDVEDAVPYGRKFHTPYEFHTPSVSQRLVGKFYLRIIKHNLPDPNWLRALPGLFGYGYGEDDFCLGFLALGDGGDSGGLDAGEVLGEIVQKSAEIHPGGRTFPVAG